MQCITCNFDHSEKYCPNCGEKADTKKITLASMSEEAISTLTNMDKGILYNLKYLIINPHQLIKNYLSGKRKNIFNPISYFLIAISIYLLVIINTNGLFAVETNKSNGAGYSFGVVAGQLIFKYFNYFWATSILWLSISSKLLFKRLNFAEHLTINSFILGQVTLAGILSHLLYEIPIIFDPFAYFLLMVLVFQVYKNDDHKGIVLFKSFLTVLLFFVLILIVSFTLAKLVIMYDLPI